MKRVHLIPLLLLILIAHAPWARAEEIAEEGFEALGDPLTPVFSLEAPGFELGSLDADDAPAVDLTDPAIRSFPELGITVPESGPGTQDYFKSLNFLLGRGRNGAKNVFDAARAPFTTASGVRTSRLEYIQSALAKAGLPRELAWMVAQESGFNDRARSNANAYGAWQFIIGTAERFDLEIRRTTVTVSTRSRGRRLVRRTVSVQECVGCKSLEHATRAAAEYLGRMYRGESPDAYYHWKGWNSNLPTIRWRGDWGMAMAGYNTGEANIAKAIYRAGGFPPNPTYQALASASGRNINQEGNYWTLRSLLKPQTQHYVPIILAWIRVGQELAKYGF